VLFLIASQRVEKIDASSTESTPLTTPRKDGTDDTSEQARHTSRALDRERIQRVGERERLVDRLQSIQSLRRDARPSPNRVLEETEEETEGEGGDEAGDTVQELPSFNRSLLAWC